MRIITAPPMECAVMRIGSLGVAVASHPYRKPNGVLSMPGFGILAANSNGQFNRARGQILDRIGKAERATKEAASRPTYLLEHGTNALRVFSLSRQINETPRLEKLATFAKELGPCEIAPSSPDIEIASILQKITAFEPLVMGDQSHGSGDDLASNSKWLRFWDEVLNLMDDTATQ